MSSIWLLNCHRQNTWSTKGLHSCLLLLESRFARFIQFIVKRHNMIHNGFVPIHLTNLYLTEQCKVVCAMCLSVQKYVTKLAQQRTCCMCLQLVAPYLPGNKQKKQTTKKNKPCLQCNISWFISSSVNIHCRCPVLRFYFITPCIHEPQTAGQGEPCPLEAHQSHWQV